MNRNYHQLLPNNWEEREILREKGQFWTPDWVAEAMVAYVLGGGTDHIFDPAVGAGAFFLAAKSVASRLGRRIRLLGTELDPEVLEGARASGLSVEDLEHVEITDFILRPPAVKFDAIVANPPYIRHHRLSKSVKAFVKEYSKQVLGKPLDGRTGYHVYFLIRALMLLNRSGRLCFIVPADTCEGIFARGLWEWITHNYKLDAVVTFEPEATPFPGVDTNPIVLMIRNDPPGRSFYWVRCCEPESKDLTQWCIGGFDASGGSSLRIIERDVAEAVKTGLTREPLPQFEDSPRLINFASVMRGIATGANGFFLMTRAQAKKIGIPDDCLVRAIARTRDVEGNTITDADIDALDRKGRPTCLLYLDGTPLNNLPKAVQEYLKEGNARRLHQRPLISRRKPWYKMEKRKAPPFLFAYLGRRNTRFIRNVAGVIPLTGFLCVYPHHDDADYVEKLWSILSHDETRANLALVAKSYGQGALKVEPRALEQLPLPERLIREAGLSTKPGGYPLHQWIGV